MHWLPLYWPSKLNDLLTQIHGANMSGFIAGRSVDFASSCVFIIHEQQREEGSCMNLRDFKDEMKLNECMQFVFFHFLNQWRILSRLATAKLATTPLTCSRTFFLKVFTDLNTQIYI